MPRRRLFLILALACGLPSTLACAMKTAPEPASLAAGPSGETRLGSAPVTVALPPPAEERLAAVTARGGHLFLAIEGVRVLHPGAVYQVYLDLPPGKAADPAGPYYVGNLSLFTEPGQTDDIHLTYDVTGQVRGLRQRGEWKGPVRVTFVRERLGQEAGAGPAGEPPAFLRFTRVALIER